MSKRKRTRYSSVCSAEEGAFPKTAQECLFQLLETEEFCDTEFEVGPTRERIRSNKMFLMERSPIIRSNFNGIWEEQEVIKLPQFQPSAFRAFLKFIYTDHVDYDPLAWIYLLEIGQYFKVTDLVQICVDWTGQWIFSIVMDAYQMRTNYEMRDVMANLGTALARSFLELSKLGDFKDIDDETLRTLLEKDDLSVSDCELSKSLKKGYDVRIVSSGETAAVRGIGMTTLEEFQHRVDTAEILPNDAAATVSRHFLSAIVAERQAILFGLPFNATPHRCRETVELYSPLPIRSYLTSSITKNDLLQGQIELYCKSESVRPTKAIRIKGCGDYGIALTAVILKIPHLFQDRDESVERVVTGTLTIATISAHSPSACRTLRSETLKDKKLLTGSSYLLAEVIPPLPLDPDGMFFQISASLALNPSEWKTGGTCSLSLHAEALKEMPVAQFCTTKMTVHISKPGMSLSGGDDHYQLIRKLIIKAM